MLLSWNFKLHLRSTTWPSQTVPNRHWPPVAGVVIPMITMLMVWQAFRVSGGGWGAHIGLPGPVIYWPCFIRRATYWLESCSVLLPFVLSLPNWLADRNAYADDYFFPSPSFSCSLSLIALRLPIMKTQPAAQGWTLHPIRVRMGKGKLCRKRTRQWKCMCRSTCCILPLPFMYNRQAFRGWLPQRGRWRSRSVRVYL